MIRNPVLHKELLLRARMRQPTPVRVGVGLTTALLLGWTYYEVITSLLADPNPSTGHTTWGFVMWGQFLLVCLVAPAITANAIAQEKEQQTWEMLLFTRLRADEIVLGKLLARMAIVVALMAISLPISALSALHANVNGVGSNDYISTGLFVTAYLTTLMSGLFFATFGLFMSWLLNRTLYALIMSYTFVFGGLILCTTLITAILSSIVSDTNFFNTCPLMWFNPIQLFVEATYRGEYISHSSVYLIFGLVGYGLLTALMLWRMIAGFRRSVSD